MWYRPMCSGIFMNLLKGRFSFFFHLVHLFDWGFGVYDCDGDCVFWLCSLILKVDMIWWHSLKKYNHRDCMLVSGLDPSLNLNGNMGIVLIQFWICCLFVCSPINLFWINPNWNWGELDIFPWWLGDFHFGWGRFQGLSLELIMNHSKWVYWS